MNESLESLLERLGAGDESAAARLVATYDPYLRRVVRRYLPGRARARFDSTDVVQSVWVHVLVGLRAGVWHFPDPARWQAFLVKVARRRLISRCRHHRAGLEREQGGVTNLDGLPAPVQPRPSEVAQARELWQRMLRLCPEAHREVLRLRRQGLPLEEVARRVGLHEGSVRRILRRLARQLTLEQEPLTLCASTREGTL